jgi:hypothetical protein
MKAVQGLAREILRSLGTSKWSFAEPFAKNFRRVEPFEPAKSR